jgi:signal transduction histidine kinase/CheY-like chemotaxis protein/HPt (histidine-containing phosphotransfer) domain-containing protein
MTIRLKLIIEISIIVALICAATLGLNLALTQMNLSEITKGEMQTVADMADNYMTASIKLLKTEAVSVTTDLSDVPDDQLPAAVQLKTEQATHFIGIAVLDHERVIASYGHNPASSRITDKDYAERAFSGDKVISSTTVAADGVTVFYVCVPMENGRILVATVDGMFFSNLISKFRLWGSGSLFMVDREGTIIASYHEDWVKNRVNFIQQAKTDSSKSGVSDFVSGMISKERFSAQFDSDGIERIGVTTPVNGSLMGWSLAVIATVSESPMMHVRNMLLLTSAVSFIICLAIAVFASSKLAKPFVQLDEQNTRLAELKEEAEFASQTKSSFLANTSHEMRTPLNAIIGLADLSLSNDIIDPELRSNLEKISNSGVTLLGIINDLLDISKIESGKFELVAASYDVPSLINDTISLNIIRIGSKPIQFKLDIEDNLPARLIGDELRIKQIFNNLLSNAFKYTKEGEVIWRLTFEEDRGRIWLVSTVKDSGIGIRPEDLQKLFGDYNQVDVKTNRAIEGTGLGLAVVKRLAELMGGEAKVESVYGHGSTFTVRLPQERDGASMLGYEAAENLRAFHYTDSKRNAGTLLVRASLPDARVLVVDDVSTNLDVAKGLMKPYDMQIVCVTSGQEAIDLIRAGEHFDAVFMDHMMPEMDGIEAVRIIREEIDSSYAKELPIIALTANALVGNDEMFLGHGFQAFLSKPIDIIKLDAAIRQWIKSKFSGGGTVNDAGSGSDSIATSLLSLGLTLNDEIYGFDIKGVLARFNNDGGVVLDILKSFLKSTPPLLENLTNSANQQGLDSYAVTVHGIKGSSRGIGAVRLGDAAESLEVAAKAGELSYIEAHTADFIKDMHDFLCKIEKLLAQTQSEIKKPRRESPDPQLLDQLYRACDSFSMDEADLAIRELERYDYQTGNEMVSWLRHKLDKMEFEEISNTLADNVK